MDPYTKQLKSVQLGNYDFQVVIDCTTVDIQLYKEYLESDRLFIGWNLKFDLKFLFHQRIVLTNVYDGYLAEKLMWLGYPPGVHSLSLKTAGETYCGVELDKSVRGQIIYAGLTNDVVEYSANDVKYLIDIKNKQMELLREKGLHVAIQYENKFVLPLSYMEYCGIKLDVDKWKAKMKKDKERELKALENCNKWLINESESNESLKRYIKLDLQGDLFSGFNSELQVDINWNSSLQVSKLFRSLGVNVEIDDRDNGGLKDSINAKVLEPQKDKCSLIPIYLDYKEAVKLTSTYGQNFLDQVNPIGRICTNYNQLGADSTRITSGGKDKSNNTEYLNLLNLPADEETRACFVAEEGNRFLSIDYVGQESFLMASIANDEAMIKELTYGDKDLHTLTAKIVFPQIPKDMTAKEVKKNFHDLRQKAKGYEFAFNYMGDATTIKRNFGLTDEEANRIYNAYMSGFSGLKKYQDEARKDWWKDGYILINPKTGHKAYIYDWKELKDIEARTKEEGFWEYYRDIKASDPNSETVQMVRKLFKRKSASSRQSGNYKIQGTGSMCLRVALINFFKYLVDNNLLFKVKLCVAPYDEVDLEAPNEVAEEVAQKIYECMVKSGEYFCTRCKLDAEMSREKDGSLPNYWIH